MQHCESQCSPEDCRHNKGTVQLWRNISNEPEKDLCARQKLKVLTRGSGIADAKPHVSKKSDVTTNSQSAEHQGDPDEASLQLG